MYDEQGGEEVDPYAGFEEDGQPGFAWLDPDEYRQQLRELAREAVTDEREQRESQAGAQALAEQIVGEAAAAFDGFEADFGEIEASATNSSRASSVVSRRETRLRTASVTTAAWSRGPNDHRDPAGASAALTAAHSGQHTRCRRCSATLTAIDGSSAS